MAGQQGRVAASSHPSPRRGPAGPSSAFPSCRQDPTVLSSNIQEYEDEHEDVDEEQEVQGGLRNPIEISSGRMPELTEDAGVGWTPLRLALVQLWDVKLPQLGR